jgi:hypothetical protein
MDSATPCQLGHGRKVSPEELAKGYAPAADFTPERDAFTEYGIGYGAPPQRLRPEVKQSLMRNLSDSCLVELTEALAARQLFIDHGEEVGHSQPFKPGVEVPVSPEPDAVTGNPDENDGSLPPHCRSTGT